MRAMALILMLLSLDVAAGDYTCLGLLKSEMDKKYGEGVEVKAPRQQGLQVLPRYEYRSGGLAMFAHFDKDHKCTSASFLLDEAAAPDGANRFNIGDRLEKLVLDDNLGRWATKWEIVQRERHDGGGAFWLWERDDKKAEASPSMTGFFIVLKD